MTSQYSPFSNSSPSPSAQPVNLILRPCSACKFLKKACDNHCIFAPHFPPADPTKYHIIHDVFGTRFIKKTLQGLPEHQRADAVASILYEANARISDPVYGCVGMICQLQNQVEELKQQLAVTQVELVNVQSVQANPVAQARYDAHWHSTPEPGVFQASNLSVAMDMDINPNIDVEIQRDNNTNVNVDYDAMAASWLLDEEMPTDDINTDVAKDIVLTPLCDFDWDKILSDE